MPNSQIETPNLLLAKVVLILLLAIVMIMSAPLSDLISSLSAQQMVALELVRSAVFMLTLYLLSKYVENFNLTIICIILTLLLLGVLLRAILSTIFIDMYKNPEFGQIGQNIFNIINTLLYGFIGIGFVKFKMDFVGGLKRMGYAILIHIVAYIPVLFFARHMGETTLFVFRTIDDSALIYLGISLLIVYTKAGKWVEAKV